MNHILLGASIGFTGWLLLYAARGFRASLRLLMALPLVMGGCAFWAIVPDVPRALGLHSLYLRLANDPRCNLFFWHYTLDQIEIDAIPYHGALALLGALALGIAWRELALLERERPRKD